MKRLSSLIIILLFFSLVKTLLACSCLPPPPISREIHDSSVIFSGTVISSKYLESVEEANKNNVEKSDVIEKIFTFRVIEVLKGKIQEKEVDINAGRINNSCYQGFTIGESYLVYSTGASEQKLYGSLNCGLTSNLKYAKDQIIFVRKFMKGESEPQIYGAVGISEIDNETGDNQYILKSGYKVVLQGNNKRFEALTNEVGIYEFNNIPNGRYFLRVINPKNLKSKIWLGDEEIYILPNKKIITGHRSFPFDLSNVSESLLEKYAEDSPNIGNTKFKTFTLIRENKVNGTIVDMEGKTFKYSTIRLVPPAFSKKHIEFKSRDFSRSNGKYFCSDVTPGEYLINVQINAPFDGKDFLSFYFPDNNANTGLKPIKIGEDDKITYNIKVPVISRKIIGKVYWEDGKEVVGDAWVYLTKSEQFDYPNLYSYEYLINYYDSDRIKKEGMFILEGFENAEYWIHVQVEVRQIVNEKLKYFFVKSKPMKIKIGKINEPLKIIIPKLTN